MGINTDHVTGLAVGLGAAALGFYLYKKNQNRVDEWLRAQGINVPTNDVTATAGAGVEAVTSSLPEHRRRLGVVLLLTSCSVLSSSSARLRRQPCRCCLATLADHCCCF